MSTPFNTQPQAPAASAQPMQGSSSDCQARKTGLESRLLRRGDGCAIGAGACGWALNVLLLMMVAPAMADAPKVDRIFPLGGQRGSSVEVALSGKVKGPLAAWSDCEGLSFAFSEKFDKVTVAIPAGAPVGRCFVRFHNADGATKLFPFVVGTLAEANEVEPNNRSSAPQKLAGDTVVNGVLSKAGDVDVYSLALRKGQTFVASMNAMRLGSPMDGVLQLLNGRGTVVTQNDEGNGFDPQIVFTVPADGDYMVRAFAFPSAPNSSIRFAGAATYAYRLTLTTGPMIDHTLPLVAEVGSTKDVGLVGWNLGADARSGLSVGSNPETLRTTAVAGNAIDLPLVAGTSLVEGQAPAVLELPFSMSGTIAVDGEVDTYRFKGAKGNVAVNVVAQAVHSALDPVLIVRAVDGKVVKELDDISRADRDIRATVKLPADGEYSLELRDRFGHGGPRSVYAITCAVPRPDFRVTAAADSFVVSKAGSVEIPLVIDRRNGFSGVISIVAGGLPEGASADAVKSEPKGATSKAVKLVVRGGPGVSSGPIRLRCTAPNGETRLVTFAVSGLATKTSELWLTVVGTAK